MGDSDITECFAYGSSVSASPFRKAREGISHLKKPRSRSVSPPVKCQHGAADELRMRMIRTTLSEVEVDNLAWPISPRSSASVYGAELHIADEEPNIEEVVQEHVKMPRTYVNPFQFVASSWVSCPMVEYSTLATNNKAASSTSPEETSSPSSLLINGDAGDDGGIVASSNGYCAPAGSQADEITVVTFNVWFGQLEWERRCDALLECVRQVNPDVVVLQEVTKRFLDRLMQLPWIREHFWLSDVDGATFWSYGVLIMSRLKPYAQFEMATLPSSQDRCLMVGHFETKNGRKVHIGGVHLESMEENSVKRKQQITICQKILLGMCESEEDVCVIAGDFNFDPSWDEQAMVDTENLIDCWAASNGIACGFTEDSEINGMLKRLRKGRSKTVRFDRVMIRRNWVANTATLLGTSPLHEYSDFQIFPSDHFGLCVKLSSHKVFPRPANNLTLFAEKNNLKAIVPRRGSTANVLEECSTNSSWSEYNALPKRPWSLESATTVLDKMSSSLSLSAENSLPTSCKSYFSQYNSAASFTQQQH